jgi:hypothetical protein
MRNAWIGDAVAFAIVSSLAVLSCSRASLAAQASSAQNAEAKSGVLSEVESAAILPLTVFFAGQSATIQGRNSKGVRLSDGKVVLATVVDTSGYSSGVANRYQLYPITEAPLHIGHRMLAIGAYGCGLS